MGFQPIIQCFPDFKYIEDLIITEGVVYINRDKAEFFFTFEILVFFKI